MKEKKEWKKLSGRKRNRMKKNGIMEKKREKMRQTETAAILKISGKIRHFHQKSLQQLKVQKMLFCTFVYLH